MILDLLILFFSLYLIIKGATLATKHSAKLAENFNVSKYVVSFIVVAFISILPETLISINAAIKGIPEFGLGTLFGANIADLTIVFTAIIFAAGRGIKIESRVLHNVHLYPLYLLLPIIFGLNGHYSRIEGVALILCGGIFYYFVFKNGKNDAVTFRNSEGKFKHFSLLIFSMAILLLGSHFVVLSATGLAEAMNITPILIGLLVVGLGTTMPELFYSLKAVRQNDDSMAVGDVLGTVLADATIVVGILAFLNPFFFPVKIIYVTGIFMVIASLILLRFMRSGRVVSRTEAFLLFLFWILYVIIELLINS